MIDVIDESDEMRPKRPPFFQRLETFAIVVEAIQYDWERSQNEAGDFDS